MRRVCLQFATACAGYAYSSLPHVQGTLTIRYRMRRVRLQFATACLEYVNKVNHTLILPFQLNQVKTYEKSDKSKKLFLTPSSGPQGNLKQLTFCANSKSKIVVSVHCAYADKDKMSLQVF
jgi:hypothetical protein